MDYYAAMLLASEIDRVGRFASPKKLVSWAGMCPTVHQSGNTMYHGRMKKDSNRKVNWVLIQAAHVAVLYDGRMRDYYGRMKKTHHSSIAITHAANKMIKIIWHMLTIRMASMSFQTRNFIATRILRRIWLIYKINCLGLKNIIAI